MPESHYTKLAEEAGFLVKTNVDKNLTYLISEDLDSTSGKAEKARKFNIPIINIRNLLILF